MKKILPLALFAGLLLAACGWTIAWFAQASHIRHAIEDGMNGLDPALGSIKAASVTTSGFPTRMIVTITNPTVTLNMKNAMTQFHKMSMAAAGSSAGVLTTPTFPDSTLQYALTGSLIFTVNAFSDDLQFYHIGKDATSLTLPDTSLTLATSYNNSNYCEVKLVRGAGSMFTNSWDFSKALAGVATFQNIRELNCILPGSTTTNIATNQVTISLAPSQLVITNTPAGGQIQSHVSMVLKDYEVTQAGDAALNLLKRAITPVNDPAAPVMLSAYGKQSLNLELAMMLPKDTQNLIAQPFDIDLKQLSMSSDAGKAAASLRVTSSVAGKQQQGDVALNVSAEFTPKQSEIARANMGHFIEQMRASGEMPATTADPAQLESAMFNALPNVTAMGPIAQKLTLHYALDKEKNTGDFNVSALELSTRDYGLFGNGQANIAPGPAMQALHAGLTCKNCLSMLDMLGGWMVRVEAAVVLISPDKAGQIAPTPAQTQGMKQLFEALGLPSAAAPADLQFTFESTGGAMSVNGKTMPEVMQLMQTYLGEPQQPVSAPAKPAANPVTK